MTKWLSSCQILWDFVPTVLRQYLSCTATSSLCLVSIIKCLVLKGARWKSHRAHSTLHLKQNVWYCVKVFGLWHMTSAMVSTCCSRIWLNLSSSSFFIFYTPVKLHCGSRDHSSSSLPVLPYQELESKHFKSLLWQRLSSINALWLQLIALPDFPVSKGALFVLVLFCGIEDQYYRFPRWAHKFFFFSFKKK